MRSLNILAAMAIVASLSGCMSYKPVSPALHETLNEPYRLDSGDRVRVTVFEQEGLTSTYAIDKGGYVSMPLVGAVAARGQTTKELEGSIGGRLRQGFLRDPNVSVEVETYRPFYIMGEVTQGGQYSYFPGMTVQNAVAMAGGFSPRAEQKSVDLTRQARGRVSSGRALLSDPIQPGDTVFVRERWF